MPKVGETMEKGTVIRWLRPDGAWVEKGEPLVEIETEKVTLEIEAPASGRLQIVVPEETELPPGDLMAYLLAEGEHAPTNAASTDDGSASAKLRAERSPEAGTARSRGTPGVRVSPVAKKLATENGVDLLRIRGTGPGGRILERDVLDWIENNRAAGLPKSASAEAAGPDRATELAGLNIQTLPYRGLRKTVGERMHKSLQEMAQLTISTKVDVSEVNELRQKLVEAGADAPRPTYTDFVVKAVAKALREHPQVNSRLAGGALELLSEVNVGLAIAVDDGLIVGVVRDADHKTLSELAHERARLSEAAREGRLTLGDVTDGTFTVSTLGAWGIDVFTPIVNPPEAGIIGVGVVEEVLRPIDGRPVVKMEMRLNLSFDHRVLDGVPAALFLSRVREMLERPHALLL